MDAFWTYSWKMLKKCTDTFIKNKNKVQWKNLSGKKSHLKTFLLWTSNHLYLIQVLSLALLLVIVLKLLELEIYSVAIQFFISVLIIVSVHMCVCVYACIHMHTVYTQPLLIKLSYSCDYDHKYDCNKWYNKIHFQQCVRLQLKFVYLTTIHTGVSPSLSLCHMFT